ncbi:MAG TPA: HAMP domain-containing sensor histidine kinase, partial [Chloroflexota bacterium]|nr:HAMP domain-containing sensor histidine kinase [Chloroflexota bacterium]
SHELRNPLLAIRMNLDLLGRVPSAAAREECLHEARQQVERMSRLVADLLLLAQVERGLVIERTPVELADVAARAAREAQLRAMGQTIRLRIRAHVFTLGDEDRLLQVLLNLLDNAIKHTPAGGTIELGLDTADGQPRLWVEDNGAGIPAEHLPRIFDRAYRINPSEPGPHASYGLGLAIVKYLTEAHGGRVSVTSQPGQGARFEVRLPLLAATQEEFPEPGARMGETPSTAPERELQLVAADGPRTHLGGSPGSDSSA